MPRQVARNLDQAHGMTFFKRLLKNIFRTALRDVTGAFIRWQTVDDLVVRIMKHRELRDFWTTCDGLVVDEGLQIAGDDYDTMFVLQDVLSNRLGADCHFPLLVLGSEKQTLAIDDGQHGDLERPLLIDARCWGRTFGMRIMRPTIQVRLFLATVTVCIMRPTIQVTVCIMRPTIQVRFAADPDWGDTVQAATDGTYNDAMAVPGGAAQRSTAIIARPLDLFLADHGNVAVTYVLSTHREVAKQLYERIAELGDPNPRRHRASLCVGNADAVVQAHRKGADGSVVRLRRSLHAIMSSAPPVAGIASEESENCAVCWREFVGARLPLDVLWVQGMYLQPREDVMATSLDGSRTVLVRRSDIGVVDGEYDGTSAQGGAVRLPVVRLPDGTRLKVALLRTKAYLFSHYVVAQLAWSNDAEARTKGSCQGGTIPVGVTVVDSKANFQKHSASMTWGRFPTARGLCVLGEIDRNAFDVDEGVRRWCSMMASASTPATVARVLRYVLRDVHDAIASGPA